MSRCRAVALSSLALFAACAGAQPDSAATGSAAVLTRGWAALRAMDCARCHGHDYRGLAAPSLIAAVREGTRQRFEHYVLEGDVVRGMPGYRSQALVVAQIDAIYAYLRARAEGVVDAGAPVAIEVQGCDSASREGRQ